MHKVFLDVDGVLCDWNGGVRERYNIDYPDPLNFDSVHESVGMKKDDFWIDLHGDVMFWANLKPTPYMQTVLDVVFKYHSIAKVCLLTSMRSGPAMEGRYYWIEKHLPQFEERGNYLFGPNKHFCARYDTLLIDDANHNIEEFKSNGGDAIVFPRNWNYARNYQETPVAFIANRLERLHG